LILKNFTEPLLKLGKNEFERGVKEGGNSSNLGLPIYTLVDGLISGISRLDCVVPNEQGYFKAVHVLVRLVCYR
jgi:hypothetical protein